MTGKEENLLVEEGRNMLRVRQSSDIFALCEYYEEKFGAEHRRDKRNILLVCSRDHSYGHRMSGGGLESTWAEEEKT